MIRFKMDLAMKLKIKKGLKKWIKNNPQKHKQHQQKRKQGLNKFFQKNPDFHSYICSLGGKAAKDPKKLDARRQKGRIVLKYIRKLVRDYKQKHPFEFQCPKSKRQFRKFVLKLYDYKCVSCGFQIKDQKIKSRPLDVHHIDQNDKNNDINNVVVLCKNCHSLTKNYGFNNRKHKDTSKCKNNRYMMDPIVPTISEVL